MTHLLYRQAADRSQQPARLDDEKQTWTVASTGPSLRNDMHELGNLMLAMHFCLLRLRGGQCSGQLEDVAKNGLELSEQGIAMVNKLDRALRPRVDGRWTQMKRAPSSVSGFRADDSGSARTRSS